jgi:hypothetical protein
VSDKSLNAILGQALRYYKSPGLDLKPLKIYFYNKYSSNI